MKENIKKYYRTIIEEENKNRKFLECTSSHWFKAMKLLEKEMEDEFSLYEKMDRITMVQKIASDKDCKKKFSLSPDFMLLLTKIPGLEFETFLKQYKPFWFKELEKEEDFEKVADYNIALIRLLDFLLEKKEFKKFELVLDHMEVEFIKIWCDINVKTLKESLNKNLDNVDLLLVCTKLFVLDEKFVYLFEEDYLKALEKSPSIVFSKIFSKLKMQLTEELINEEIFKEVFKQLELKEQISIMESFEKLNFGVKTIKTFHTLLNKNYNYDNINDAIENVFEVSKRRLNMILTGIENSSLFHKENIESSELWQFVINFDVDSKVDKSRNYFMEIVELYKKCMKYAKESIVNALYPLNTLTEKVTHINQEEEFNILIRVMTASDYATVKESFTKRTFCGFSIITEKNFSHYVGGVKYGYFTGIEPELIAHIYPIDSFTNSSETNEFMLTSAPNMLFDIKDLTSLSLKFSTYCQVTMKTKLVNGNILWPDCIVCYDEIDEESQKVANDLDLKILVIHRRPNTIEHNKDIFTYDYDPLNRIKFYGYPYAYKNYFIGK